MKKRLDIQALLQRCNKEDIEQFLKVQFRKNKALESEFLIHFAATFDLDEEHFSSIIKRIESLVPKSNKRAKVKNEQTVFRHIHNLLEQARDCIYSKNFQQGFIILSQTGTLLEKIGLLLEDQSKFLTQYQSLYAIFQLLYLESPARPLNHKIEQYLLSVIQMEYCCIPSLDDNPYQILTLMDFDKYGPILIDQLNHRWQDQREKSVLTLLSHMLIKQNDWIALVEVLQKESKNYSIYQAILWSLDQNEKLPMPVLIQLEQNYYLNSNEPVRPLIFKILKSQASDNKIDILAFMLHEYFLNKDITTEEMVHAIEQTNNFEEELHQIFVKLGCPNRYADRLYQLLYHLNQWSLLRDYLNREEDIFVFIAHAGYVYEQDPKFVKTKLWNLTHQYLSTHFGRPAIDWLDEVVHSLLKNSFSHLQDFLFSKVKDTFGHRRHFQKLMKEIA